MSDTCIFIRSGGIGDFVLALPILRALRQHHQRLVLVSRRGYLDMVRDDRLADLLLDLEGPLFGSLFTAPTPRLRELLAGSTVYSFLPDADGDLDRRLRRAGAADITLLVSRPDAPPHVIEQAFVKLGLPVEPDLLAAAPLSVGKAPAGDALWLHPGSGSPAKNAPPDWFAAQARDHDGPLIVSFGEADLELESVYRELFQDRDCEYVIMPSLFELRQWLRRRAARFAGNDSGVTHLAAALGIPTTVAFVSTDPAIWRPVGPAVNVVRIGD